jgi:O-acetyl-ADP-ribose deacetylase (regulator of RNase III)
MLMVLLLVGLIPTLHTSLRGYIMLKYVKGDLIGLALDGEFDVIVHGCNCFNTMGAGIAYTIAKRFPQAYEADMKTIKGDYNKLGNYTKATGFTKINPVKNFQIINAYTQYGCDARKSVDVFEYVAFDMILQKLANEFPKAKFGLPLIGMGLAGGNKTVIMKKIEEFAKTIANSGGSVTMVEFSMSM